METDLYKIENKKRGQKHTVIGHLEMGINIMGY